MSYRLGVDVGGTFTDLLLINEDSGESFTAKVLSTPEDSSIGVLNGVALICEESSVDPKLVRRVMHGTTVATNAVLTGRGAKVGLVTTQGYKHTLQVARSFCPGGLGGWVSYMKKPLLAPLELTIEADERIGADGGVVSELDKAALKADLQALKASGKVEALTICFINAYVNGEHEVEARDVADREGYPGLGRLGETADGAPSLRHLGLPDREVLRVGVVRVHERLRFRRQRHRVCGQRR